LFVLFFGFFSLFFSFFVLRKTIMISTCWKKNACLGNVLILHNSDKRNKETVSERVSEWVSEWVLLFTPSE
jgi:hypothetical protein